MLVFPNSKINLGLSVLEKRSDGYHNISSVFYPIPYQDVLEVVVSSDGMDSFHYSGIPIPGESTNNLCVRAVNLLREQYDFPFISVYLHKAIAMGAGLGGGSADASYLLRTINEKFELCISSDELKDYSLLLGSDCPFFIDNIVVGVTGRGESFEPIKLDLKDYYLVLVSSEIHISTANAYQHIQRNIHLENPIEIVSNQPIEQWKEILGNDFEGYAFETFPVLKDIKSRLYQLGAEYASMTGSGSTIYGIFRSLPQTTSLEIFGSVWTGKL